jgi:hypothetical protein
VTKTSEYVITFYESVIFFFYVTSLLAFQAKIITLGVATCFDYGGHPRATQFI